MHISVYNAMHNAMYRTGDGTECVNHGHETKGMSKCHLNVLTACGWTVPMVIVETAERCCRSTEKDKDCRSETFGDDGSQIDVHIGVNGVIQSGPCIDGFARVHHGEYIPISW